MVLFYVIYRGNCQKVIKTYICRSNKAFHSIFFLHSGNASSFWSLHCTILPPLLLQFAEFVKGRSHGAIEQPLVKLKGGGKERVSLRITNFPPKSFDIEVRWNRISLHWCSILVWNLYKSEQAFVIGASLTKLKRNLSKLKQIFSD